MKTKLKSIGKFTLEVLYNAAIIVVLVVLLRTYIISPFKVVGDSMKDTLLNGELILINKIGYLVGEPDRGDVIVFLPPITERDKPKFEMDLKTDAIGEALELDALETTKQNSYCQKKILQRFWFCKEGVKAGDFVYILPVTESNKISGYNWVNSEKRFITKEEIKDNALLFPEPNREYRVKIYNPTGADHFVKRIIGLPGDTIKFEVNENGEGLVYLKKAGETEFVQIKEPYLNDINTNGTYLREWVKQDTFVVPKGMYFGMGDNRGFSNDSRSFRDPETKLHTPFITKDQMSGKVMMVLLPLWKIDWIGGYDL